ncbi:MAG TPA: efflux RND transporter periplasmic adaptor subunit, partial [Pirellulales bacterium]|nr:efflux RND transporter periplasmic adaptor subunit [Pirellulales bacterium]
MARCTWRCRIQGRRFSLVSAIYLTFIAAVGCTRQQNQYAPPPPPKVVVTTPVVKPVTIYHEYTGTTQASEAVQLRARVQGYLQKIGFEDGVNVEKNQLLFVIDPRPFQAALDQAKADLESKQAVVAQTESIYKRDLVLLPTKAKSQEEADVDRGNWLVAKANVEQAQANIRQAQLNLEYSEIRAPFAGR